MVNEWGGMCLEGWKGDVRDRQPWWMAGERFKDWFYGMLLSWRLETLIHDHVCSRWSIRSFTIGSSLSLKMHHDELTLPRNAEGDAMRIQLASSS